MPEPEPEMSDPKRRIVPHSHVEATRDVRGDVFSERDLQRHIGKYMDIRSRLKLAVTSKTNYAAGKEDVKREHGRTNYITQKVFKNVLLQDYIGSHLSPAQRSRVRSATMTQTGTRPQRRHRGIHLWGPGARGTYFDDDNETASGTVRYLDEFGNVVSNPATTPLTPGLQRLTRAILHEDYLPRARPHTDFRIQYPT